MTPSFSKSINALAKFALLIALMLSLCQCATPPHTKLPPVAWNSPGSLAPGDVIKLTFPQSPELNQAQKIRPDGRISLPLVGEVSAAGKVFSKFQAELEELYKSQLKSSEVVVSLESSVSPSIVVDGAVAKPGNVPADRPMTVFEAIMQAGGFSPTSDLKRVKLFRLVNGEHRSQVIDMRGAMTGAPTRAIPVKNGDIIFVPEKTLNL